MTPGGALLDEVMPVWHVRERHRARAAGEPHRLRRAFEETTWGDVPLFRTMIVVASAGRTRLPKDLPVLDTLTGGGFTVLAGDAAQLVVAAVVPMGAGGRVDLATDPAATFRGFDRPGYYKVAMDFRNAAGTVATETRVFCTDEESRRRFSRYWALIRAPSGLIRREWLRGIRRRSQLREGPP